MSILPDMATELPAIISSMLTVVATLATGNEPADLPAGTGAMAPKLSATDSTVILSWLEPAAETDPLLVPQSEPKERSHAYRLLFSKYDDGAWSQPVTVVQRDDFFVNWADVPSVVEAPDGSLTAHWLQKSGASTYAYDAVVCRSTDDGKTWTAPGPLHDDGTKTEHGFVSLVPASNGTRAFWLDGREMSANDHGHGSGSMTIRTAMVTTDGISDPYVLDDRVCECCPTDAAMTSNGPVFVYRDRGTADERDIGIVRLVNGSWTKPALVHADGWEISGCPVNGPAIAADGDRVWVAWFTAAGHEPRVRVAFSSDAGATFGEPINVDINEPHGRVDVLIQTDGSAIVCWLADEAPQAALKMCRAHSDGRVTDVQTLAAVSPSRATGMPTMARIGERILVVWTEATKPLRLRGAFASITPTPALRSDAPSN